MEYNPACILAWEIGYLSLQVQHSVVFFPVEYHHGQQNHREPLDHGCFRRMAHCPQRRNSPIQLSRPDVLARPCHRSYCRVVRPRLHHGHPTVEEREPGGEALGRDRSVLQDSDDARAGIKKRRAVQQRDDRPTDDLQQKHDLHGNVLKGNVSALNGR
ncbi:hypothetical protein BJV82DRAFT_595198 [Fennellomyces sp. T-0311]|nr:hypothetical protein BJV82DRAFT_595198 [Fennellomyces sp. T-0311]